MNMKFQPLVYFILFLTFIFLGPPRMALAEEGQSESEVLSSAETTTVTTSEGDASGEATDSSTSDAGDPDLSTIDMIQICRCEAYFPNLEGQPTAYFNARCTDPYADFKEGPPANDLAACRAKNGQDVGGVQAMRYPPRLQCHSNDLGRDGTLRNCRHFNVPVNP